jgi:hypothetical protein
MVRCVRMRHALRTFVGEYDVHTGLDDQRLPATDRHAATRDPDPTTRRFVTRLKAAGLFGRYLST